MTIKQHAISRLEDQIAQDEEADEQRYTMLLNNKKELEGYYAGQARILEDQHMMDK